jgi:hypothetical protein
MSAGVLRKLVQLGDHTRALGAQAEVARRKLEAWTAR